MYLYVLGKIVLSRSKMCALEAKKKKGEKESGAKMKEERENVAERSCG